MTNIKAKAALILYDDYIEVHEIRNGKLGPGKPCSEFAIKHLKRVLSRQKKETYPSLKGIVPSNLIYLDSNTSRPVLIWRTEKHKQKLLFDEKKTGIVSGEAEVPNMIWKWDGRLEIYAYKIWKGMDTELFYVPLPNTNQGGVCLGNVKVKNDFDSIEDAIQSAMNYYWNSTFTHKMDFAWTDYWQGAMRPDGEFQNQNLEKERKYKLLKNFINENIQYE